MKRILSVLLLSLAVALPAVAEGPAELFQKAKEQVKSARWKEALTTLDALDAATRDPSFEAQRKQVEPAIAFYRAVSMANLDRADEAKAQFQIYLTASPNASLDRAMYTKKTMDAFDDARKTMARPEESVPGMPSLAASYRDFRPTDAVLTDPPGERWADGPVKVLLTADDKRQWTGLMDPASRSEFITKFWAARDPKPETPDNEFRQDFEKRVALLPSGVPYQQVDFEFITRKGYGTNVLQRDSPALATLDAARQKLRAAARPS